MPDISIRYRHHFLLHSSIHQNSAFPVLPPRCHCPPLAKSGRIPQVSANRDVVSWYRVSSGFTISSCPKKTSRANSPAQLVKVRADTDCLDPSKLYADTTVAFYQAEREREVSISLSPAPAYSGDSPAII